MKSPFWGKGLSIEIILLRMGLVLTLFVIDTVVSTGVGIVLGVAAEDIPE